MDYKIKSFKPNKNFEKIQAEIYTKFSGLPADVESIKRQFSGEEREKSAKYVLGANGEGLAYVQSSNWIAFPGTKLISYPWALPDCPVEAQDKIFDSLLEELKSNPSTRYILAEVVLDSKRSDERIDFFKRKGFIKQGYLLSYTRNFDVDRLINLDLVRSEYLFRSPKKEDHDQIVKLCRLDPLIYDIYPSNSELDLMLENRFYNNDHSLVIYKQEDGKVVAFGTPRRMERKNLEEKQEHYIRFFCVCHPDHYEARDVLLRESAKICKNNNWNDPLIISSIVFTYDLSVDFMMDSTKSLEIFAVFYACKP